VIKYRKSAVTEPTSKPTPESMDPVCTRLAYDPPRLTSLGDVRDLTLGGSPGTGDSGNPGTQQF
jgi:hypothetical protein